MLDGQNYYVKRSDQHGTGVFASAAIPAGAAILEFTGPTLAHSEIHDNVYHLQVGETNYLGPSGSADDYVNHSCEPNAGFTQGLTLVAIRDISINEEITWDYSTAIDENGYAGFPCRCGSKNCRELVGSFRDLAVPTQLRLKPWLLPYLHAKYFPELR